MNLLETEKRVGYVAALETNYINTTDMCLELFFWPVTEANSLYRPSILVLAVTEETNKLELARSTGYELEMWNRLFAKLPNGIYKVTVEARRSDSGKSGMSIDDVVVQPCVSFGKTHPKCLKITQYFVVCNFHANHLSFS